MKRRNADCGKLRRPMKRNKITEGMYGSTTVLYMKFLILWAIVMVADFMFMFRFEFLWPFWLLLRSVHDSFKYKGLAFSVLFVCIAITSDLVCLFFIPVHWLLFAASTYVWVQYVWHTDKGICLPTIILWMLFVYLEVGIRWKDSRHIPHLDLCRPFAAHCIGYPVVTLGFGFKSYVGYRMRQRKQREVAKDNEFYMQLLLQALPAEEASNEEAQGAAGAAVVTTVNSNTVLVANGTSGVPAALTTSSALSSSTSATSSLSASAGQANGVLGFAAQAQNHHDNQSGSSGGSGSNISGNTNHHHHHHQHNNNSINNNNNSSNSKEIASSSSSNCDSNTVSSATGGGSGSTVASMSASSSTTGSSSSALTSALGSTGSTKQTNTAATTTATSNGHAGGGGGSKNHRRSMDKDKHRNNNGNKADAADIEHSNSARQSAKNSNGNGNSNSCQQAEGNHNSKEKTDWESSNSNGNYQQQNQTAPAKDKHAEKKTHNAVNNGNMLQSEAEDITAVNVESAPQVEKTSKSRRNRGKRDSAAKDNHSQPHRDNAASAAGAAAAGSVSSNNDACSVSSTASSTSSNAVGATTATAISHIASKVVSKICETCLKLEADVKKYRAEISHMKQIENELRQKLDVNLTSKSSLQAKQKECDELEKRIQELNNARHADILSFQNVERRLNEERRQKQSLDAQLANEKKARKTAEEKAARPECSAQCKQRRQQIDEELKRVRNELKQCEEAKQLAVDHGRKYEQEYRIMEAKVRVRDSTQADAEMLMNALATMQEKNTTLEKNLSAETRVKLDLFSALGAAKRKLEISDSHRRSKEDEVIDLKAKIAQLLAVMPDTMCMNTGPHGPAASMLRMNDTPPLQSGGPGPSSPMLSINSAQDYQQHQHQHQPHQQPHPHSHSQHQQHPHQQQQQQQVVPVSQQQQQQQMVPVSVAAALHVAAANVVNGANGLSTLDPNASVYTPKAGNLMVVTPVGLNPNGTDA